MSKVSCDIAVVGGGFAGVVAARDAATMVKSVVLFEATDRLGGRAWTRPVADTDIRAEFGATWVAPSVSPSMMGELERYGLGLVPEPPAQEQILVSNGRRYHSADVPEKTISRAKELYTKVTSMAAEIDTSRPLPGQRLEHLDVSLAEIVGTSELEGDELLTALVSSFVCAESGVPPEVPGMLQLLTRIADNGDAAQLQLPLPPMVFRDGTSSLVEAMAADVKAEVRKGTPVAQVRREAGGVTLVAENGDEVRARACILAVPTNLLPSIDFSPGLPAAKLEVIRDGNIGKGLKINMVVENAPLEIAALGWGGAFHEVRTMRQLDDGRSLITGFGCSALAPDDIADRARAEQELREFVPDARVLVVDAHDWNEDRYIQGTWRTDLPGRMMPYLNEMNRQEPPLFFAGSDIAPNGRANMDGAVQSGRAAAQQAGEFCAA